MEALPGLVKLHVLSPPTLPALREELDRARGAREPYHVVHFDGHGVYDRTVGLGGLCFEEPQDIGKLDHRRHVIATTDALGPLLRDHRIPLVFLEACQTASRAGVRVGRLRAAEGRRGLGGRHEPQRAGRDRAAVRRGILRRARPRRPRGRRHARGQRTLKDDTFRGASSARASCRLEDWFVPVLFQEKEDPQLFKTAPAKQTVADFHTALAARLGELPRSRRPASSAAAGSCSRSSGSCSPPLPPFWTGGEGSCAEARG